MSGYHYVEKWVELEDPSQIFNEMVTYPKISVGDTVFAIEWIQSLYRIEDEGICLYANTPPFTYSKMNVGLFRRPKSQGPLHIFMPGGLRTENVQRLKPSYDTKSNVKIDGYYDKIRDCIVLTVDKGVDILERDRVYGGQLHTPIINRPDLVFETEDKLWSTEGYMNQVSPQMIIQLAGCARVEQVDPLVVGDFIGTRCENKLLGPYNSKKEFGSEYRDVKSEIWNLLPGPVSEEINYNIGLEDDVDKIYRHIDPNKRKQIAGFSFSSGYRHDDPVIRFYDMRGESVGTVTIQARERDKIRISIWRAGFETYDEDILKITINPDIAICKVMKKLIERHPKMNRTHESEMKNLEACAR